MLKTLSEAWRGLKGFQLKCHIATAIWFVVFLVAVMISLPILFGLGALDVSKDTASTNGSLPQLITIAATMPMMVVITIVGIRHSQGRSVSAGSIFNYLHRAPTAVLQYFLTTLMIMLLLTLGMIPLGIPLIWIVPWVTLACAIFYFKLSGAEARTLANQGS